MKKKLISAVLLAVPGMIVLVALGVADLAARNTPRIPSLRPDIVATSTTSKGNIFVENRTEGYALAVPSDWRTEMGAAGGLIFHASSSVAASDCKIEISRMENPGGKSVAAWLTDHLYEDPTTDVVETNVVPMDVGGAAGIVWEGTLNGVSSTAAYVASGTAVFEIAPSMVAPPGVHPEVMWCRGAMSGILRSFQFTI